jgi:hypothetical protein
VRGGWGRVVGLWWTVFFVGVDGEKHGVGAVGAGVIWLVSMNHFARLCFDCTHAYIRGNTQLPRPRKPGSDRIALSYSGHGSNAAMLVPTRSVPQAIVDDRTNRDHIPACISRSHTIMACSMRRAEPRHVDRERWLGTTVIPPERAFRTRRDHVGKARDGEAPDKILRSSRAKAMPTRGPRSERV